MIATVRAVSDLAFCFCGDIGNCSISVGLVAFCEHSNDNNTRCYEY